MGLFNNYYFIWCKQIEKGKSGLIVVDYLGKLIKLCNNLYTQFK